MKFLSKSELYSAVEVLREEYGELSAEPFALAESLGIKIAVYRFDSRRFSGALMKGKNMSQIIINAWRSPEARRFTAAHELIHYFFHASDNFFCSEDCAVTALEWQANEGAAELLIPYKKFLPAFRNIRSLYISDSEKALRVLAKSFGATPAMVRTLIQSLSPEIAQFESGVPLSKIRLVSKSHFQKTALPSVDISAEEE